MERVIISGTATSIRNNNFSQAGKTGTAQAPYGQKDHSNFIMFAPVDNPKIAIAVVIQNGGFGSKSAAPIASLIAEKYLFKKVDRIKMENLIRSMNFYNEYKKIYIHDLKQKGWYNPFKKDSLLINIETK